MTPAANDAWRLFAKPANFGNFRLTLFDGIGVDVRCEALSDLPVLSIFAKSRQATGWPPSGDGLATLYCLTKQVEVMIEARFALKAVNE